MKLLLVIILALAITVAVFAFLKRRLEVKLAEAIRELGNQNNQNQAKIKALQDQYAHEAERVQADYEQRVLSLEQEATRIRNHYESESRQAQQAANDAMLKALADVAELSKFASLRDAEAEVKQKLKAAIAEAEALQREAHQYIEQAKLAALEERSEAQRRVKDIHLQAEALLTQAFAESSRISFEANQRAQELAGDAYEALINKGTLEDAAKAMQNVVDGYGDRYIVPTHSLIDDLAADFGHLAAGESLRIVRDQSRNMVVQGKAATCDYVETSRRATAVRFVVDAFNGKVDGILSRIRHDNHGTLEREIRDAFSIVNLNGEAFRRARILPSYLDSRLEELRWAAVAQELRRKEREEQRQLQEQMREEEKVRREYERAIQEAAREEAAIKKALEQARREVEQASEEEKQKYEKKLVELENRLTESEAKNQRVLSMAQQTRSGNVYIISNIGSFGEDVIKIGMTRRLDPMDRIKELGDASVPFAFDVHAMIRSDDAPGLERMLHQEFDALRINKVNYRKEFFQIPLQRLRDFATQRSLEVTFTMTAEAREYRESRALEKMSPEDKKKYHITEDENSTEE
jgi:phage-related minor tail protein